MQTHIFRHRRLVAASAVITLSMPLVAFAQSAAALYSDVPQSSPVFAAVQYLQTKGVLQPASQFKPGDKLTRAQAVKILVASRVTPDELAKITKSSFSDVPASAWYMPYAEAARTMGIVDSAPAFHPDQVVTKAGFMKMLLASEKIDYNSAFSDFKLPLATDVPSPTDWFYAVIRYAIASSMTAVDKDGLLAPSHNITRSEMALIYYRLDMYVANRRTQALLSQTETDIGNVLQMLTDKNIQQAEFASARSMLAARGALVSRPNEPLVKGAVKVTEGFQSLVLGYQAGASGDFNSALKNAKDTYASAAKAKAFSPGLVTVTTQMQAIAKNMADQARKAQAASTPAK
jgi:hypothetical protein